MHSTIHKICERVGTNAQERDYRNFMKFTDLCMMDTLPEFLHIPRISQRNYYFSRTFKGRGKIPRNSRSEVQIPEISGHLKFQEPVETLKKVFLSIYRDISIEVSIYLGGDDVWWLRSEGSSLVQHTSCESQSTSMDSLKSFHNLSSLVTAYTTK